MESYPEASVPVGGVLQPQTLHLPILGDPSGSDGFSEVLLDQYTEVDVSSEWLSSFVEDCLSSAGNCLVPPKDHQTPTTATNTGITNSSKIHQEVDVSSKWLSSFVEDCLSSAGNCLLPPKDHQNPTTATNTGTSNSSTTLQQVKPNNKNKSPTYPKFAIPAKPRSQRKKRKIASSSKTHKNPLTKWSEQLKQRSSSLYSAFTDPPLLEQTHWLADSELLTMPRKEVEEEEVVEEVEKMEEVEKENSQGQEQLSRRCTHCQAQETPQWRAGPMGPKTLCNACGMRYFKSGRLLPEYRPANSPTFMSFKHSNSHKKVLQMRMALLSSSTSGKQ